MRAFAACKRILFAHSNRCWIHSPGCENVIIIPFPSTVDGFSVVLFVLFVRSFVRFFGYSPVETEIQNTNDPCACIATCTKHAPDLVRLASSFCVDIGYPTKHTLSVAVVGCKASPSSLARPRPPVFAVLAKISPTHRWDHRSRSGRRHRVNKQSCDNTRGAGHIRNVRRRRIARLNPSLRVASYCMYSRRVGMAKHYYCICIALWCTALLIARFTQQFNGLIR